METFKILKPDVPEYVQVLNINGYEYQFMVHDGRLVCGDQNEEICGIENDDLDSFALSKKDSIAVVKYLYDRIIGKSKPLPIQKKPSCGFVKPKKSLKKGK